MNASFVSLQEMDTFDWSDYAIFALMLGMSTVIGIYFGCFGNRQNSIDEYLLGGKNMKPLPVALSLVASSVSAFLLISIPAEVYTDGASYWLIVFSVLCGSVLAYFFFLPVFYELKLSTANEYLELRFSKAIRSAASVFFCAAGLFYMPAVIYVPAITLSQVTGLNVYIISTIVTAVCVFYTMIGGLKAVVWTDFLQITITVIACFIIIVIGTIDVGGISSVFTTAYNNGVLDIFNMDPNPFQKTTFWTILAGGIITTTALMGTSQANVQRFLALSSAKDISKTLIIYWIVKFLIISMCILFGLIIYAAYYGCDPVKHKMISRTDRIVPYYIINKIGHVPMLPGLFVAGVFSAGLSTLSTVLNTIAGIVYEDIMKHRGVSNMKAHILMKSVIVALGVFCVAMIFVIERMGKILAVTYIISSIAYAPVFTVFVLGLMIPISNTKGCIAAMISSTLFLLWIATGSALNRVNFATSNIYPEDTCPSNLIPQLNSTMKSPPEAKEIFFLYKLSFMHYINFGLIIGLIFGVSTSYITGPTDPSSIDLKLISPPLRRFFKKKPIVEETFMMNNTAKLTEYAPLNTEYIIQKDEK